MEQSRQVLEWQAQAEKRGRREGRVEGRASSLEKVLRVRFGPKLPAELKTLIKNTTDGTLLEHWLEVAVSVRSLEEFQRLVRG